MAFKIYEVKLSELGIHNILRSDYKYFDWLNSYKLCLKNPIRFKEIVDSYFKGFAFKSEDFIEETEIPVLKGIDITDYFKIDYNKMSFVPYDFYTDPKYQKFKLYQNDVVITLVGSIGKLAIIDKDTKMLLNQNNIAIRLKSTYNTKFFAYCFDIIIKEMINKLYKSSGYSFLRIEDLFNLNIPNIPLKEQEETLAEILPIENMIQDLESHLISTEDIINKIISSEFHIDVRENFSSENDKIFELKTYLINERNQDLRFSYRWNKLKNFQKKMFKNIQCLDYLSNYIKNTKNGWSPMCNENCNEYKVLGIDSIKKEGCISFENIKYTDAYRKNIKMFFIKEGDFFVSRGNTPNLVAQASIVKNKPDDCYIFSDLMIRVQIDDTVIDKEYLAYIFNSFIGRTYFKYASKGKNQTMVKISIKELNDFLIPIPKMDVQYDIVNKIKKELEIQKKIKSKIEYHTAKIYKIIRKHIMND